MQTPPTLCNASELLFPDTYERVDKYDRSSASSEIIESN